MSDTLNMASKPFQQLNQRLHELYRRKSVQSHQQQYQHKIYYYRKGRIPNIGNQMQKPGYIRNIMLQGEKLKFSNDSRRVQAERVNLRREITHLRMQINQQKFYKKTANLTPQRISQQVTPKRRINTEISPQNKTDTLPLILRKQSTFIDKMKIVAEKQAQREKVEIEGRALQKQVKQLKNRKQMIDGLKGKCYYAMMREISIPNSFSS